MSKSWRLQDMTFRQWAVLFLVSIVLSGLIRLLAQSWGWNFMGLPIDFWKGFLETAAKVPPVAAVVIPVVGGAGMTPKPRDN